MDPHLQDLHPVYNFLPPPNDPLASQQASKAGTAGGEAMVFHEPRKPKKTGYFTINISKIVGLGAHSF